MEPSRAPHAADLELAGAAVAGSREARQRFAQRMECVPRMLAARNARLSTPLARSDLEDLVQDTLVSIWRRLETYRGMASLETWAWRFCMHHLANHLRARARAPVVVLASERMSQAERPEPILLFDEIRQALERLDERDAVVVRLRHFEQMDFADIGRRLDIPANTAKSRYYRGLLRLREMLGSLRREDAS